MRLLTVILSILLLSGCASSPGFEYDPGELQFTGRVINKTQAAEGVTTVSQSLGGTAQSADPDMLRMILAGIYASRTGYFIVPGPRQSTPSGPPTEYIVELESGTRFIVFSYFEGFGLGDCVTVFVPSDTKRYQTRMAYGNAVCTSTTKLNSESPATLKIAPEKAKKR